MQKPQADFLSFLTSSCTVYHAAHEIESLLRKSGFLELKEKDSWKLASGQGYFLTKGGSLVAAFRTPLKNFTSATLLATHIDSPGLKLRPKPEQISSSMSLLSTEVYGSPLLHTWMDRDLHIAGRVVITDKEDHLQELLVCFDEHPVSIASLALHLDRTPADKGVIIHKQDHLKALFGLGEEKCWDKWLKEECKAKSILGFDLFLVSAEAPRLTGKKKEFVSAARLDNLTSAYAACKAIGSSHALENCLQMALFFDHEEIGSMSAKGADSVFVQRLLERVALALGLEREELYRMESQSLCISGDLAHGIHPNFIEKFDVQNAPELGKGIVFKYNASQKYATDASLASPLLRLAQRHNLPTQVFVSRSDIPSGSTVGSMIAAQTGITTVDLGIASLAMHSIRETIAIEDEMTLCKFFQACLQEER